VLATYYPNIRPGQARLAVDLGVNRGNVNKRMRRLEDAGLISRVQRGRWRGQVSTLYRLKLAAIRAGAAEPVSLATHKEQTFNGADQQSADWEIDF